MNERWAPDCRRGTLANDIFGNQGCKDALPKAAVGNSKGLYRPNSQHGFHDGATGKDKVGSFRANARLGGALFPVHGGDAPCNIADALSGQPASIHLGAMVFREAEINAGNGRDGSGRAKQVRASAARPFRKCRWLR